MGLLDQFANLNPEQTQGLLAAAAQMLQQSGPSRTPNSFMQIAGGGLSAYQDATADAKRRKREEEQAAMQKQLYGLKIRDSESDFNNQESLRQKDANLRQFYIDNAPKQPQAGMQNPEGLTPASHMGGGEILKHAQGAGLPTDMAGLNQAVGQINGGQMASASQPSLYQQRLDMAAKLRAGGFGQEADAQEATALKFQPKVKSWQEVTIGNRVLLKPYFEDGTAGDPVPADVAAKLEKVDLDGKVQMVNAYNGKPQASYNKTVSPSAALTARVQMRGQDLVDGRAAQEIAAGGKPPPGYRWAPGGSLAAIPGGPGDKLPESQQKQVVGVNNLSNAIREYRAELASFGTGDALKLDTRAKMGTKYNNMMLQAKEAYNLGVLNGPDLSILTSVITDPRSVTGFLTSKGALDTQASELDRIMQDVGKVSGQVRQPQNQPGKIVDWSDL